MRFFNFSFVISLQKTAFEAVGSSENIAAKLQQMKQLGFSGVEFAIRDPQQVNIHKLKKLLEEIDLKVCAIGTGQAYSEEGLSFSHESAQIRKAAVQRIQEQIKYAAKLKSLVIIGLIRGNFDSGMSRETQIKNFKDSLIVCLESARKRNISLVLEPINRYECNFLNSVSETVAFVSEIAHPNLKILADIFHMNIEDKDFNESLLAAAPLLGHVHFADSNRWFPGSGHIDFQSVMRVLQKIQYKGFISGEFLPRPTEEEAMKGFSNFINIQEEALCRSIQ